jgi:hypothetical protein
MTVVIADNQIRITAHDRDRPRFAPQPDAPDIDDEMRVADRLKAGGLMTTAYSRAATSATTGLFGDRTIGRCGNGRT